MKPSLIDKNLVSKLINNKKKVQKKITPNINYSDYYYLFFNLIALVFIIIGSYILYMRNKNKLLNKKEHVNKIKNFYKEINNLNKLNNNNNNNNNNG